APAGAAAPPRVQISATRPGWAGASIRMHAPGGPLLERELDVSTLPIEARPLAIASATDELVRSTLDGAAARASGTAGVAGPARLASSSRAEPSASPPSGALDAGASGRGTSAPAQPRFELGLGVGGVSHPGQLVA